MIEAVFQSLTTFDNNLTDDIVKLFHSKVENSDSNLLSKFKETFFVYREEKIVLLFR